VSRQITAHACVLGYLGPGRILIYFPGIFHGTLTLASYIGGPVLDLGL
jgi:hypothetical protein